ncbi:MAG: excinuclease ABC subunit UvrB [Phycisphaeraceae bacterium]|nr:MAG: excinuclease ABC subunit UvrB [Phycisphaeraceae bacterium]
MRVVDRAFEIVSEYTPTGDQPGAIADICERLSRNEKSVTLLGATGTGKTFTMAHVIAKMQKPALILSHNKTLAAQLFEEMRELLPNNAVNYFVSYYDYYQPEAYIPQRDIYIEKDSSRNDDLDRLRLAATSNLLTRRDTVVVASVSCIFGLGSPEAYEERVFTLQVGMEVERRKFLLALTEMQYERGDFEFKRGSFRVRGDTIEVYPAYEQYAVRVEMFGDEIESLALINPITGEVLAEETMYFIFPAVHYVTKENTLEQSLANIRAELDQRVMELRHEGKLLEAQRLIARTKYDLEMIEEVGYCNGIENYSRHLDGRQPGERPFTLLDYFFAGPAGKDWLLFVDESHVTVPQVRAMYNGDQARKKVLVEHGFRLPSAMDNRPLKFEEFESIITQTIFVSATPGPYELERTGGEVVEQVIRPTGLLDPAVEVRPAQGQVADLLEECRARVERGERVLITALTKRLCEDLTNYLDDQGLRVRYLHSEIETLERLEILRDLRTGTFDVLVGVNLLREGLDLPEVSLVCILDADKTGFLRSPTSLVQTIGRAARNVHGKVLLYADSMTPAMQAAMEETDRRRDKQRAYNEAHGITPETIRKAIRTGMESELKARKTARRAVQSSEPEYGVAELLDMLEQEMLDAAQNLEFERAASLRDQINHIKDNPTLMAEGVKVRMTEIEGTGGKGKREKKPGSAGSKSGRAGRKKKRSTRRE